MSKMIQLDFFEQDETSALKQEIQDIKTSTDKVRKSLFAKNGELTKKYNELLLRLEVLERGICQIK